LQPKVRCPICRRLISEDRLEFHLRIEQTLIETIKKEHPDWVESDGACPECVTHYRQQISRLRGN
jgi:hypothetical protein